VDFHTSTALAAKLSLVLANHAMCALLLLLPMIDDEGQSQEILPNPAIRRRLTYDLRTTRGRCIFDALAHCFRRRPMSSCTQVWTPLHRTQSSFVLRRGALEPRDNAKATWQLIFNLRGQFHRNLKDNHVRIQISS
jgi:hypothetical protein